MTSKSKGEKKPKPRLGTNPISDVIQEISEEGRRQEAAHGEKEQVVDNKIVRVVPMSSVVPDPGQPRKNVDPDSESIRELAESIKKHGFINFITVREEEGGYLIIAGERRFTAAKVAGLEEIPVMVVEEGREPVDCALLQMEENLQREDLTALEELEGYNRLVEVFELKQRAIVGLIKKSESYVSKMLSLNRLSQKVREDIVNGDMPVARDILWDIAGYSEEDQEYIWKRIREKPVRSVLDKAKNNLAAKKDTEKPKKDETGYDADVVWEALKKAVGKDKNRLFEFVTPKKVERLMGEFGSEIHLEI